MNDFLQNTKQAFDKIAGDYDRQDNSNPVFIWMRKIVHKVYLKNIKPSSKILEINAGTGVDAVFLAQNGMTVYATDISGEMINVCRANAKEQILNGSVKCEVKSFDEINTLNEKDFDAVVSNFGGLNCINYFSKLSADMFQMLSPGGKFIAVVMNRICLWEIFYFMLRLDFKNAFRRLKRDGIYADLNGLKVKTFYFSPGEFTEFFGSHFKTEKVYSLGYFVFPPYLVGIYNRFKSIAKLFMKMDEVTMGLFPFNRLGDNFIIVMSRK